MIILSRYGSWENGHINAKGRAEIQGLAFKLQSELDGTTFRIITADVTRAEESAAVLAEALSYPDEVLSCAELSAEEENGKYADLGPAVAILKESCEGIDHPYCRRIA